MWKIVKSIFSIILTITAPLIAVTLPLLAISAVVTATTTLPSPRMNNDVKIFTSSGYKTVSIPQSKQSSNIEMQTFTIDDGTDETAILGERMPPKLFFDLMNSIPSSQLLGPPIFPNPLCPATLKIAYYQPLIDVTYYRILGSNLSAVISRLDSMNAEVQKLFIKSFNVHLISKSPIVMTVDGGPSWNDYSSWDPLDAISDYRMTDTSTLIYQLHTARKAFSGIVGLSFMQGACSLYGVSWVVYTTNYNKELAVKIHEMGHVLGSPHDSEVATNYPGYGECEFCQCSGKFIMHRFVNPIFNFSYCSQTRVCEALEYPYLNACVKPSICGDGICTTQELANYGCQIDCLGCSDENCELKPECPECPQLATVKAILKQSNGTIVKEYVVFRNDFGMQIVNSTAFLPFGTNWSIGMRKLGENPFLGSESYSTKIKVSGPLTREFALNPIWIETNLLLQNLSTIGTGGMVTISDTKSEIAYSKSLGKLWLRPRNVTLGFWMKDTTGIQGSPCIRDGTKDQSVLFVQSQIKGVGVLTVDGKSKALPTRLTKCVTLDLELVDGLLNGLAVKIPIGRNAPQTVFL